MERSGTVHSQPNSLMNKRQFKGLGTTFFSLAASAVIIWCLLARHTELSSSASTISTAAFDAPPPACGQLDDRKVHLPPDWTSFVPPAVGKSYVDPAFGCSVKRLTNSSEEETLENGKHPGLMHFYSTLSPMNASDTLLLITSSNGAWRVKDSNGILVVPASKMPSMNNGVPVWDASDGDSFYYTHGKNLEKGTIKGKSVKSSAVHTYKEYSGIISPAASDLSQDRDHIVLVGQNSNNTMDAFVWSFSKQTKTSVYTTSCKISGTVTETPEPGCLHKILLTPDNLLSIQFAGDGTDAEQGARLWDGKKLSTLQDATNHYDTGYDLAGKPIFVAVGNSRTQAGLKNPCPSGWGLDVRQLNDVSSAVCLLDGQPAWHVSYRGSAAQPWMAISFFDDRNPGPELFGSNKAFQPPTASNWHLYEDEIILARIDGGAIYRLAHARSRSAENYWAQPHAAISRDGKYVIFTSNMAYPNGCPAGMLVSNECMDVYLIQVR